MVRRYAIESGVPIVRSDYSGISAFVAADGNVEAMIPIGVAGHIDGTVCGAHRTAYRKFGRDMWMIIILVVSCLGTIWIAGPPSPVCSLPQQMVLAPLSQPPGET